MPDVPSGDYQEFRKAGLMAEGKRSENAAQKIARLLSRLNDELVGEGSDQYIMVEILRDGAGALVLKGDNVAPLVLYDFNDTDSLTRYLEMAPLERLVASVASALNRQ